MRRIFNYIRTRVFFKLFLSFTMLLVITLSGIAIIASNMVTSVLAQKEVKYNSLVMVNIDNLIRLKNKSVHDILIYTLLKQQDKFDLTTDFFRSENRTSNYIIEYDAFKRYIISTLSIDKDISGVTIYKKADSSIYTFSKNGLSDGADIEAGLRQLLSEQSNLLSQAIYLHPAEYDSQDGQYTYSMSVNVKDIVTYKVLATILLQFPTSHITKLINSYYQDGVYSDISIITTEGNVLYNSNNMYYGGKYPYMNEIEYNTGSRKVNIGNQTQYLNSYVDNELGLIVVAITPMDEITKGANTINRTILVLCIIALAVTPVLAYGITGIFSRRIEKIIVSIKRIMKGDLSERVAEYKAKDEISDIAYNINHMCGELEMHIQREYISQLEQKEIALRLKNAELKSLQSQINPHFLYNTLEAIRMKANLSGAREAGDMIMILSKLFRNTIKADYYISLDEEIQNAQLYGKLFQLKYRNLSLIFDMDEKIGGYLIIRNIFQPVIENCIVHGCSAESDNIIQINGYMEGDFIVIDVLDQGKGIEPDMLRHIQTILAEGCLDVNSGIGLLNVHERLRLVFGEDCGLSIFSGSGAGTLVRIKIKAWTIKEMRQYVQDPNCG